MLHYRNMKHEDADGPGQDATVTLPPGSIMPGLNARGLFGGASPRPFATPTITPRRENSLLAFCTAILRRVGGRLFIKKQGEMPVKR